MEVKHMNYKEINPGILAYLGDAVYELEIRKFLIESGNSKVNEMDKEAVNYVSAVSQSKILDGLINRNLLTEEELNCVMRARNYTPHSKPRRVDIKTYKKATALEALFGMLYIYNKERISEIMKEIKGE